MADLDWPTALIPQGAVVGIKRAGPQFRGAFNGQLQVLDLALAARLTMSLALPAGQRADAGAVEAYLFQIAGGVNKAKAWHFGRPVPYGSLRNSPTLNANVARGDGSITLAAAYGRNVLKNSSFEVDSNADGLSDSWSSSTFGSTGAVTFARSSPSPIPTTTFQYVNAAALGTGSGDKAGILQSSAPVGGMAGSPITLSTYAAISAGAFGLELSVNFYDAGAAYLSTISGVFTDLTGAWGRRSFTGTVPANAVTAEAYILMRQRTSGPGTCTIAIDGAQLEIGAMSDYEVSATLKAGDMLGLGNHLLMCAGDCTANAAAQMTVPLVNRIRETVTAGTAVVWNRPTALWVAPSQTLGVAHHPGAIDGAAVDLEEWWP